MHVQLLFSIDTDYIAHAHGIKVLLNKMEVFLLAFFKKKKDENT